MPATVTEIARAAKVSKGLVSRLIRKDPTLRVSEATRRKVIAVEKRLGGARVNRLGRSLATRRAYNVVLPVNRLLAGREMSEPGQIFLRHVEATLKAQGFRLSVNYFDPSHDPYFFRDLLESPDYCDGLLLMTSIVDAALARLLLERRFPHVSNDGAAEQFEVNTVTAHAAGGIRLGLAHLVEMGHRHIGFLGTEGAPRFPIFVAAMLEKGLAIEDGCHCRLLAPSPDTTTSGEWSEAVKRGFAAWLDRRPSATALICQNDMVALAALEVLRARGLAPGQGISLIGYDNLEERGDHPATHPVLTTIDNPADLIGQRCGELLVNQILHKQQQIVHEHIPVRLIVRKTTGPCHPAQPGASGELAAR